jgi:hypothetical protein
MGSLYNGQTPGHCFHIKREPDMPQNIAAKNIRILPVQDSVFIDFAFGPVPGMKFKRHDSCFFDKDVRGKKGIEPSLERINGYLRRRFEITNLV